MSEKIDPENLEQLKESVDIDNTKLEELMKIDPAEMTPETQQEFLSVLKESSLYIPIEIDIGGLDLENAEVGDVITTKEETGFSIRSLVDGEGNNVIPLFTNDRIMEEVGLQSSCIVMYMDGLADMISQSNRDYHAIVINPNTEYSMGMNIEHFLNLFE